MLKDKDLQIDFPKGSDLGTELMERTLGRQYENLFAKTHMKSLCAFFFFWWENTENASTKFKREAKSPRLALPRMWYFGPAEQLHWLCDDI